MAVLRTWGCLNDRCGGVFDSWDANPPCPACGCLRVAWQPAGGHVSKSSSSIDATFRDLANCFKMTDMDNGQHGQRGTQAKLLAKQPVASGHVTQFAPGFAAPVNPAVAQCLPSSQPVNFKVSAQHGQALSPNGAYPRMSTNTRIEARHSGK